MGGVAHGWSRTPTYKSWHMMVQRCTNRNFPKYPQYGGRGIKVDSSWFDFKNFLADMGPRPEGTTLGRKDNDQGYNANNCEWQTSDQQGDNKTTTVRLEYMGENLTMNEWSRKLNIPIATIRIRRKRRPDNVAYILAKGHARRHA